MKAIKNMSPKAPLKGELKRIPIRKIVSKEQVRKQFQNIEELAQSILMEGLHTPITVEQESEDRYVIIQGERRWRACLHAGLTEIDAIIREPIQDKRTRILAQLTENIQREEMNCEEIAMAIQGLMNLGMSSEAIGKALGKNRHWAYVYSCVADLPVEVKEIRDRHGINDPYILRPLKKMFELNEPISRALIQRAQNNHVRFTRETAQHLLNQVNEEVQRNKRMQADDRDQEKTVPEEPWMSGCKASTHVCVYCWVRLPGHKELRLGRVATDRVAKDSEFVCVFVDGQYQVVSILDVAFAGVKDRKEPIDDLL